MSASIFMVESPPSLTLPLLITDDVELPYYDLNDRRDDTLKEDVDAGLARSRGLFVTAAAVFYCWVPPGFIVFECY